MSSISLGDLSQQFQSIRNTTRSKNELQVLTGELSSGQKSDLAASLRGDTGRLISLDRELATLREYSQSTSETAQTLAMTQVALGSIETLRARQAEQSLPVGRASTQPIVDAAAKSSVATFEEMVSTLNQRAGDRSLFAGRETDGAAFADAATMLNDLASTIGPTPTVADVRAAVDFWFDDPAGGFATMGYVGDTTGPDERAVSSTQTVSLVATGESQGIKEVLKALAIGAMADEVGGSLSLEDRGELVRDSGVALVSSSSEFNALRGSVGISEAFVADKQAEHAAQISSMTIMRNDLTQADPFETAIRLQEVQRLLETQYAVTARLTGLSLANYL